VAATSLRLSVPPLRLCDEVRAGLHQDEVEEIVGSYRSAERAKDIAAKEDLSADRVRVLIGSFLCLIDPQT